MQQKAFTLHNRGMNRDLSISKAGESSAYENHNICIIARDNDTMLSVTNERGNKEIPLDDIQGTLIGWNVLNQHVILFTTDSDSDRIYRIDYDGEGFTMANNGPLYTGHLGFDAEHPIESVVYHESEDIQKIYWVDGIHVLRFMNFMAKSDEMSRWEDNSFDSNIYSDYSISVDIDKDYSGNNRPNGVIQYLITYYNRYGQETGYAWISDLIYLSPKNNGGSADGTNTCNVKLSITFDKDNKFTNFRVYSIFRSSLNKASVAYLVADGDIDTDSPVLVSDDGSHLVTEDITRLLYLGSQDVHPYTLTHKDQTLFLGGLEMPENDYGWIRDFIKNSDIYDPETGLVKNAPYTDGKWVQFVYSSDLEYNDLDGSYSYQSQLIHSSSEILSFKGGEKYRFAIAFKTKNGTATPAFWIGDAVNNLYPIIDIHNNVINRVVARFIIPDFFFNYMEEHDLIAAQLMIAEATYADRSVKAQGIINPTVFNVWERYNNRLYSMSSWISRPRHSSISNLHFDVINNSIQSSGEIQCNYWETSKRPTPYYSVVNGQIQDEIDGVGDYDWVEIFYGYRHNKTHAGPDNDDFDFRIFVLKAKGGMPSVNFTQQQVGTILLAYKDPVKINGTSITVTGGYVRGNYKEVYSGTVKFLQESGVFATGVYPYETDILSWFNNAEKKTSYYRIQGSNVRGTDPVNVLNNNSVWYPVTGDIVEDANNYSLSLFKRHLMFVDENVVTLNSPEFEYEAISTDIPFNDKFYKLRIVGVAKITGGYSDYIVDATHGKLSGENLESIQFSAEDKRGNLDGLSAWPLWKESGLTKAEGEDDKDIKERTPDYYQYTSNINKYWLYLWNHFGKIDAFTKKLDDDENANYSNLHSKTFANLRFSGCTMYNNHMSMVDYTPSSIRMFTNTGSQYTGIQVNEKTKYYDGAPDISLGLPGTHKYPVLFSSGTSDSGDVLVADPYSESNVHLFINDPIEINYLSSAHAVMSLPSWKDSSDGKFTQEILPYISSSDITYSESNAVLPWIDSGYKIIQKQFPSDFHPESGSLEPDDKYLFIGELFYDYDEDGAIDNRYGGISEFAVENCRFIPAGPWLKRDEMEDVRAHDEVIGKNLPGDRGDTYFQRWDCMKTKPYGNGGANNVIDVTSVMLETHINIDGRTDLLRGTRYLASVDPNEYGALNPVYSQTDNFFVNRFVDEDADRDMFNSSITWTLDKTDTADIDEWTHITLANSLKLDGDKGTCNALRRFNNSIIAFQDRGISEILFNSRTQLTTTDGVPVEIANSGKVDGKRYITNKYGCTNKWSIVEGKAALYFVDNINKAFCAFSGQGIQSLSSRLGFDAWFRRSNEIKPWTPDDFNNIVSFYDRIHSDVYLVTNNSEDDMPCLVYNETLGSFTSFFDYESVPMMTNVDDRFVSFKNNKMWLQNEGLYCNFFNHQYDFWVNYRVTPDPFGDKIWTNIDYRADYYRILDNTGKSSVPESLMINGEFYDSMPGTYQDTETFDSLRIWNEYQNTGEITLGRQYSTEDTTRRKFRIWHVAIPRAQRSDRNRWGLDRIRNPWINLLFKKKAENNSEIGRDLMQLHDVTVRYFE